MNKLPKTTVDNPYIRFAINKKGEIKFSATASWYGGKNSGFWQSGGIEGNSCEPKNLGAYIDAFKSNKVKEIEKEIAILQKKLKIIKQINCNIDKHLPQ